MLSSNYLIERATYIRNRLRRPANAVPDRPIDLARPRGITGYEAARVAARRQREAEARLVELQIARLAEAKARAEAEAARAGPVSYERPATVSEVLQEVSRQWAVDCMDIISQRRDRAATVPRHVGMVLARKLTPRSYPEIARVFGRRDHTTVLYAVWKYQWLLDELAAAMPGTATLPEWVAAAKSRVSAERIQKDMEHG